MTIEIEPDCACETQDRDEVYQKQREKDPYRPTQPNILQFKKVNQSSPSDTLVHYWVLRDHQGAHIIGSSHFFQSKEEAIRNCLAIFSKELWAGYHRVTREDDWELVLEEGCKIEGNPPKNKN